MNVTLTSNGFVTSIVSAIVTAIKGILGGFGDSIVSLFEDLFVVTGENGAQTISTFGVWGLAFLGVGFASTLLWVLLKKI